MNIRSLLLAACIAFVPIAASAASGDVTRDEVDKIIAGIPTQPNWRQIRISDKDPTYLTLIYKSDPARLQPKIDGEMIATTVIQALVARGHNPQKESLMVYVSTMQDGLKTVTGQDAVRPFGAALYNWTSDEIQWRP